MRQIVTLLSYMGYKIGLKCNRITLFIKFYSDIHHIYAFLHDKEVESVSFITTVEINVHNFHLHLARARTNKITHKQTNKHNGIYKHLHTPADTCKHYTMYGWAKLSRE